MRKPKTPLERLEGRIIYAKRELMRAENQAIRFNYGKMPDPLPESVKYWQAYIAALEYCHGIFKDDGLNQMMLIK